MKKFLFTFTILGFLLVFVPVKAATFKWPTTGYLGWRYYTNTNGQEGISGTYHTGVDIWGQQDGGWNNNIYGESNPVYSVDNGTVVYVDSVGLIIKHNSTLYTKYWHIRDRKVSNNQLVDSNSLLGYQDLANTVHLHLTIASSSLGNDNSNVIDPSSYFGVELDVRKPNVLPWGYYVSHNSGCNGDNLVINYNLPGSGECNANTSINIVPNSNITGDYRFYIN